jgi:hypothetical protein
LTKKVNEMTHTSAKFALLAFFLLTAACSASPAIHTPTPAPIARPTPWGPAAVITAALPDKISCTQGSTRCESWPFNVTFKSENGIGGQVENMRMVFVSSENVVYAEGGYPQWMGVNIPIAANGGGQYQGKATNPAEPDLKGGRMDFFYQGYDGNGNKFSGKLSVSLAGNN